MKVKIQLTDPAGLLTYLARVPPEVAAKIRDKFLSRNGALTIEIDSETLEGKLCPAR